MDKEGMGEAGGEKDSATCIEKFVLEIKRPGLQSRGSS
jgi:hypothetical protein